MTSTIALTPSRNLRTATERQAVADEIADDPLGVGYASMTTLEQCQSLAFRERIANPDECGKVSKPLDLMTMLALIPQAELSAVIATGLLPHFRESVRDGDLESVTGWITLGVAQEWLSQPTAAALTAEMSETIDDPDWEATVLADNRLTTILGRIVGGISADELDYILSGGRD